MEKKLEKSNENLEEERRMRNRLVEDLETKAGVVEIMMKKDREMTAELDKVRKELEEEKQEREKETEKLEKVKKDLEEEKQKREYDIRTMEQVNTSEMLENTVKDEQIRGLQRTLDAYKREIESYKGEIGKARIQQRGIEATRAELERVRDSNEKNKEKLRQAGMRVAAIKEE